MILYLTQEVSGCCIICKGQSLAVLPVHAALFFLPSLLSFHLGFSSESRGAFDFTYESQNIA